MGKKRNDSTNRVDGRDVQFITIQQLGRDVFDPVPEASLHWSDRASLLLLTCRETKHPGVSQVAYAAKAGNGPFVGTRAQESKISQ